MTRSGLSANKSQVWFKFFQRRKTIAKIQAKKKEVKARIAALRDRLTDKTTGQLITSQRRHILNLDIIELASKLKKSELDPGLVTKTLFFILFTFIQTETGPLQEWSYGLHPTSNPELRYGVFVVHSFGVELV